jgi:ParB family chromosome partitioning protein
LRLLELPEEIKVFVADGHLQAGHARALLQIRDPDKRLAVARRAVQKGLTVRQIEELARAEPTSASTREREPKRRYPDLEESLADHLGTEVRIETGRGRGRVTISFGSRDDLHRIVELLLGY